ncbi:Tellurium resistance protein TerD [hydrothermal vent metagenome]|uniref:Tellurium resistance protein TerD n=1 Tax=hydrothermal vent metagenome TaxID=652676 RepID=A0A1W1EIR0_9ZZZZ
MGISLSKGGRVNLSKEVPSLKNVGVGLGWDTNVTDSGADFDLDASVFMIDSSGKVPQDEYFVFYNNLQSPDGAVIHQGDNRTGEGEGDDESLKINLNKINPSITELVFVVTIDDAVKKAQNFGQVRNAFIRIYDLDTDVEIAKYDLEEDFSAETAIEFGRLYKKDNSWRFKAVGTGYNNGLQGFVDLFIY